MRASLLAAAALAASLSACSPDAPPPETPKPPPAAPPPAAPEREQPPASGPARPFAIPKPSWSELPNGVRVATLASHGLPLVQVRVLVLVGKSADGERPGLTAMTGDMLKDGGAGKWSSRQLAERVASLGASLSIQTGADKTVLSMTVTRDHAAEAAEILGAVVGSPQFSSSEFDKLKKREIDRTSDAARGSGSWAAQMVLYRDLFSLPTDHHPYASYDAMPGDVARVTLADVRAMHRKWFVPKNVTVVFAGTISADDAKAAAAKAFGGMRGGEPPTISYPEPSAPEHRRITLVDRPKASQSDVYVAMLSMERDDKRWPDLAVLNQVYGGGVGGRLFLEVREKQSLAYGSSSSLHELAHAPAPFVSYAGTQTAKTGLALKAILDQLGRIHGAAPTEDEVASARRYLVDTLAIKLETIGAVADELVRLDALGLPDDYNDGFRRAVADVTPALVNHEAGELVRDGHEVIVVAGDAAKIGSMLSHFGEVKVVDPTHAFDRERTIPMNPDAPLEAAREKGN
jgi:predicted Zn-dependent peptidase